MPIVKTKNVYYCEHCGVHRLSLKGIVHHERYCTANPDRRCRMCSSGKMPMMIDIDQFAEFMDATPTGLRYVKHGREAELRKAIEDVVDTDDGPCPACMLSVIRQLSITGMAIGWSYEEARDLFWSNRNQECDIY